MGPISAEPVNHGKATEAIGNCHEASPGEVLQGRGMAIADAVCQIGVTQQTYYRWRKLDGGMGREQLKRLKKLEQENQRLTHAVSDLALDKLPPEGAARETSEPLAPPSMHRPRGAGPWRLGAQGLPRSKSAPLDPSQGAPGPTGRGTPEAGHTGW